MKIVLYNRDEMFLLDLNKVMFFKAEDHYTSVYYNKDTKQLLPFGLSVIEKTIAEETGDEEVNYFVRAGRSYLINAGKLHYLSITKETVMFYSPENKSTSIRVPKNVLKELARIIKENNLIPQV